MLQEILTKPTTELLVSDSVKEVERVGHMLQRMGIELENNTMPLTITATQLVGRKWISKNGKIYLQNLNVFKGFYFSAFVSLFALTGSELADDLVNKCTSPLQMQYRDLRFEVLAANCTAIHDAKPDCAMSAWYEPSRSNVALDKQG